MADINGVNNTTSAIDKYSIDDKVVEEEKSNELGRNEFLELMIAQMENQSPLDPKSNEDFIAQLAQFSSVEGIEKINESLEDLSASYRSSQTLEATSLVGSSVTLDGQSSSQLIWGDVVFATAEIPAGSDGLTLSIENDVGEIVEQVEIGYQEAGNLNIKWDGMNLEVGGQLMDIDYEKFATDEDGNPIPHDEGEYSISIIGNVAGSANAESIAVSMSTRVDSVSINSDNTVTLNLLGGEKASIDSIKQINDI